ncbi:flavanone 3-dioxygenase 2-like [Neltuma alba]|uniref:flavanone 3-dioxygenase 2-like n=1 Tax=Neltuma alba TaxID=207710 RepID=UPI0010A467ED|nr:flavanone 3-dioxygenase 2-like [Prosopis alba]
MASIAALSSLSSEHQKARTSDGISSIKTFAESNDVVASIPSSYHSLPPDDDVVNHLADSIPIIDFSLLTSHDPQIHANAVRELGKACQDWNFFMIINHGIAESLTEEVMKKSAEFHNLPLEEKKEFKDEGLFAPIRYGTSSHSQEEKVHYWRDYLRVTTFPEFHFPHKPSGFKEVAFEYTRKIRSIVRELLQGVSESLGLEANAIIESTNFDSGFQKFQVNLYPPCPRPDLALGLPAHTDNGFFTILAQNKIAGLQVKHDGKWINVNPLPNCLLAIPGDQLELVSNGRYKSIWHRAMLNDRNTRVTLAIANGPPLEKEIGPTPKLLEEEEPLFKCIKFRDYIELQQQARCVAGRTLDNIRIT